ncbi:MAG TPA: helix-turn-helix domain-containing protein [Anaerolineales bacterium]|nr:helix-turn-helix domain-containing protein [Anaerolineales bacterium]
MRAKSEERLLAEKLRCEQGLSYNEIANLIGVSKSTLSHWLKNLPLTVEQEERIQKRVESNQTAFVATAWKINKERFQLARKQAFQSGIEVVSQLPHVNSVDELAFSMLYLGEGDKTGNRVQIASTDPMILQYFLWGMEKLYKVDRKLVSLRLNLIELARPLEKQMLEWWGIQLSCASAQFAKTQFDSRSKRAEITGNYHGVCSITYNDTYLYERLTGVFSAYVTERIEG